MKGHYGEDFTAWQCTFPTASRSTPGARVAGPMLLRDAEIFLRPMPDRGLFGEVEGLHDLRRRPHHERSRRNFAAFRDELPNLFPDDPRAQALSKSVFTLNEFLLQELPGYEPPRVGAKALVHGHCHHKAIMKMGAERAIR